MLEKENLHLLLKKRGKPWFERYQCMSHKELFVKRFKRQNLKSKNCLFAKIEKKNI